MTRALALIPARGGSKRVPRKNIRPLAGRPLLYYSVRAAIDSGLFEKCIVSTEDHEIAAMARDCGAETPFLRDASLSTDTVQSIDVELDVLNRTPGFDVLCVLPPTSPLRSAFDIRAAWKMFMESGVNFLVSMTPYSHSPYMAIELTENHAKPVFDLEWLTVRSQRQKQPDLYHPNGAIWLAKTGALLEKKTYWDDTTLGYIMSRARSLDLDEEADFAVAEALLSTRSVDEEYP